METASELEAAQGSESSGTASARARPGFFCYIAADMPLASNLSGQIIFLPLVPRCVSFLPS